MDSVPGWASTAKTACPEEPSNMEVKPGSPRGSRRFVDRQPEAVVLANGIELHAVRDGQGPPLIFIHGAMGDWRSWEAQWDRFTAHFECLAYSRRYCYPNDNAADDPDHSALSEARDLGLLMDAMGWTCVTLVGSSYGAFTALALAVQQPERVTAVVAVEPPMMRYAQLTNEGRHAARLFRQLVITPANEAFRAGDDLRGALIMTGGINGNPSSLVQGEAMRRRLQNMRAMKMLALSSDEFPLLSPVQLGSLSMPILLLSGRETASVHKAIFAGVCSAMPQAFRQVVDNCGHAVTREQPETFNRVALEFLLAHRVTADN